MLLAATYLDDRHVSSVTNIDYCKVSLQHQAPSSGGGACTPFCTRHYMFPWALS